MIKIGASGVLFTDRFTMDCHVVETRLYPNRPSDCWGVLRQAIDNGIYVIFNVCISDHSVVKNYTDGEWVNLINHVVVQLQGFGGNKSNCRLTIINEPMKYITRERYTHLINLAYSTVRGRLLVGAGNEEFLLARAKGEMYPYILNHANFDILDIHIQGSCLKESDCAMWTNWIHNLANSHNKPVDCTEANYSDVAKSSGYSTLLMQLKYAEKIFCKHFPIVFIGLSNVDKYMWLSFIYNGRIRTNNWHDLQRIMKEKAFKPIPPITEDDDMKLVNLKRGSINGQTWHLQEILMLEYGYPNNYDPPFDGKFGKATEDQVKEYQRANDLDDDGIVGKNTTLDLVFDVDKKPVEDRKFSTTYWYQRLQILSAYPDSYFK